MFFKKNPLIEPDKYNVKSDEYFIAHLDLLFKSYDLGCRDFSVCWANRQKNPCG